MNIPLSVLDLTPISAGSTVAEALRNTVDLARAAERAGYLRYWLAEHHLNPGVAGASPPLVIQAVAAATRTIRVGSGAVQTGHRTPLSVVEEFGILDALFPGRVDLGLGRSGGPRSIADGPAEDPQEHVVGGVLIPRPFSFKAEVAAKLYEKVWPLFEARKIAPVIDTTFPLNRAADAHARMESSEHIGKIVLTVG